MRKPCRTRQEVIQLKIPIALKLGTKCWLSEWLGQSKRSKCFIPSKLGVKNGYLRPISAYSLTVVALIFLRQEMPYGNEICWIMFNTFISVKAKSNSFKLFATLVGNMIYLRDFLLRTFARKFSNIDFFLKILPLKNDELVMSEM